MEKGLLIIVLDDRPFIVDRELQEFRQYNKPDNTIAFSTLQKEGKLLSLQLLGKEILMPAEILNEDLSDWAKFGINVRSTDDGWNIFLDDERLARRLCGELPHIDIAGTDFTIDWRLRELRNTELPWEKLNLADMEVDPEDRLVCFYDVDSKQEFFPDQNLIELPEHVVYLEIPKPQELDPVALAREHNLEATGLLLCFPMLNNLAASVKPLSASGLGAYIEENRQRAEQKYNWRNQGR